MTLPGSWLMVMFASLCDHCLALRQGIGLAALKTDDGATFDNVVTLQAEEIAPQVTWGTNPGQVISVNDNIPDPASFSDPVERASAESAGLYGPQAGYPIDRCRYRQSVYWFLHQLTH